MSKRAMRICFSIIGAVLVFTLVVAFLTREKEPTIEEKINAGAILHDGSENSVFDSPEGEYALKIKTIYEVAPEPVTEEAPSADRVVIVVYEYTNNSIENGLVVGSTHFKAYDKSGKELELYPQANLFEAGEIHELGTMTASIAFSLDKTASKYIEVDYYNDSASATPDLVFEGTWE